jgi:AcrR family transcriptional regulator
MPQHLKKQVQEDIIAAALKLFAEKGFREATMAEIAKAAGISTGNIYRYYGNKETLFDVALPDEFVERFVDLTRRKVQALAGVQDVRLLKGESPYHLLSEELLAFCIKNRMRIVILLGKSDGTRCEGVGERVVQELCKLAIVHFHGIRPDLRVTEVMRFDLREIYRNSMCAVVNILRRFEKETAIREAIETYSKFHLAGLKGFFE